MSSLSNIPYKKALFLMAGTMILDDYIVFASKEQEQTKKKTLT
jgi:hypothetical protein